MSNLVHADEQPTHLLKQLLDRIPAQSHLRIHTCLNVTVPPHWGFQNRINEDFHIVFIKGGEGTYTVGGHTTIPMEKGQIILVSPGMLHSTGKNPANRPSIIPVRFGFYNNTTGELIRYTNEPFTMTLVPNDRLDFQQLFERLHRHYLRVDACRDTLCGAVLQEILFQFAGEWTESARDGRWDPRVERAKRYMDEQPASRSHPNELAEKAGLSEKYFRNLFKQQYGLTPVEYQAQVRMEYARFLLLEGGLSIKQIALTLGYPDSYAFSKQYKLKMGVSPRSAKKKG